MSNPHLDNTDSGILAERLARRSKIDGPRVGDFCILKNGDARRFTHHWGDCIQITMKGISSSFYLDATGAMDYSGGLDPAIPLTRLRLRPGDQRNGPCWFFHHDIRRGNNAVHALVPCRVYEEVA